MSGGKSLIDESAGTNIHCNESFQDHPGFEEGFEQVRRERDSYLSEVAGFKKFAVLKGPAKDDHVL